MGSRDGELSTYLCSGWVSYRIILPVQLGQGFLCTSTATFEPCATFLCDLDSKVIASACLDRRRRDNNVNVNDLDVDHVEADCTTFFLLGVEGGGPWDRA